MSNKTIALADILYEYLLSISLKEADILFQLREETALHPMSNMQIAPEEGQFIALLIQLTKARKILEIGVFTGYSSLCIALALPPEGEIIACDINKEYTDIAYRYWKAAGVLDKIDLRLNPALETLDQLLADGQQESFDFVFIDADKENYGQYYEQSLKLLRPGGLIAIDNVLWFGRVAHPQFQDKDTKAIRSLNDKLSQDERVLFSLIPIADGLALVLKH
jgi:predicted O-methyltransferase YrrM